MNTDIKYIVECEPGKEKNEEKKPGSKAKDKTADICYRENRDGLVYAYAIFKNDEEWLTNDGKVIPWKEYKCPFPAEFGKAFVPEQLLHDAAMLQNKGYKIEIIY